MVNVDHPPHYGGKDNPHEAIKVIEHWGLGFKVGNALKYICRAGKKNSDATSVERSLLTDLTKAEWYIARVVDARSAKTKGHDAAATIRDERRTVLMQGGRDPDSLYSGKRVADSWELSGPLRFAVIAIEKDDLPEALQCVRNEIQVHQ